MSGSGASTVDKNLPHVFLEVDLMSFSPPMVQRVMYVPPPVPGGKSTLCSVCHLPKSDRIHIEGEAEADAESPRWGM
jgi:hypothetical protein